MAAGGAVALVGLAALGGFLLLGGAKTETREEKLARLNDLYFRMHSDPGAFTVDQYEQLIEEYSAIGETDLGLAVWGIMCTAYDCTRAELPPIVDVKNPIEDATAAAETVEDTSAVPPETLVDGMAISGTYDVPCTGCR
jgi:hypothetical protein